MLFFKKNKSWAVHKPGSVLSNHLSRRTVTGTLQRPTSRTATGSRHADTLHLALSWSCSGWGLHADYVTIVCSELLPHYFNLTTALPVSAECFCCTFPTVTCARRYLASSPYGARTFLIHPDGARNCLNYPLNIQFYCLKSCSDSVNIIPQ